MVAKNVTKQISTIKTDYGSQACISQQNYLTKTDLDSYIKLLSLCLSGSVQVVVIPSGITMTPTDIDGGFSWKIWSRSSPFWQGSFSVYASYIF